MARHRISCSEHSGNPLLGSCVFSRRCSRFKIRNDKADGVVVHRFSLALSAILSNVSKSISGKLSVYKSKPFARFAKKASITDAILWRAARLANEGIIDAYLGGGVIKQRIARAGEGKSGGSRSIILFKRNDRAVYVYGFEKKDLSNIKGDELEAFRELAKVVLGYTNAEMAKRVEDGALLKVECPEEEDNG